MDEVLRVEWDITEEQLLLSQIKKDDSFRYVFYNAEDGAVISVSNEINNFILPYVTVTYDDVKDILEGKEFQVNYKVVFSPDEKDFVLIKKDQEEELLETIHDVIFQVPYSVDTSNPIVYDTMNDLTFIQDYSDTCWKIYINGTLASSLKQKNIYFDKKYEIYVTAKNDPNILYKTIDLPLRDLIENFYYILPFDDIEYKETPISLYCKKLFTKYQHIKNRL